MRTIPLVSIMFLLCLSFSNETYSEPFKLGNCGSTYAQKLGIRDSYGGAKFGKYCSEHDRCYETCGKSKEECDNGFLSGLRDECKSTYTSEWHVVQRSGCLEIANTYHSAVHRMGGDAYRSAQEGCHTAQPNRGTPTFVKHGNNGTVSCNTFCAGSQWGNDQVGTCASAFNTKYGQSTVCGDVPGDLGGPELTCSCFQDATVRYGNNGTINCNQYCARTNESCIAAFDTKHERGLSCNDTPGYLDGNHLKCSCR